MRTRIAACSPERCSCRAVACGDPGVSRDMGRRPLVRRRWCRGSGVFRPPAPGTPPRPPRPPRSPRQRRLRSRTLLVPSCRASRQKVSRGCRAAASGCSMPTSGASRSAPAAWSMGDMAHPCQMPVHLPGDSADALASRKRHLDVGGMPAAAPNAGFPPAVRFPGLPESPPAMPHKGGFKDGSRIASGTKAAPERNV